MADKKSLKEQVYAAVIREALEVKNNTPLSQAALEVLAIIAYNQPVTKSFVEQIRGVDSSSVVNSLVAKGLVQEMGRLAVRRIVEMMQERSTAKTKIQICTEFIERDSVLELKN